MPPAITDSTSCTTSRSPGATASFNSYAMVGAHDDPHKLSSEFYASRAAAPPQRGPV